MMTRNFRPHLMSWGGAAAPKRRPSTPQEQSPEDDATADVIKKPVTHDSDNETASAASSEPTVSTPALAAATVASSFARAGKLLWSAKNPLSGFAALTKPHSRTVGDFNETDFTTPFTPGTPVWTRYGLGTVTSTRADDGFLVIHLQCISKMTLYLNPTDEDYFSVPALRLDWVETPAGEGLVMGFDAKQQSYCVRVGGSGTRADVDVNVHRSDLRRLLPVRRQTHAPTHHQQKDTEPHAQSQSHPQPTSATAATSQEPSVLTKGLNSALKTIATTSSGLTNSLSNLYYQGQYVVTTFGQGTIVALDQTNHRVQVQLTCGATAYLNTDAILHYTKVLVGMEVTTVKFGSGVVTDLRPADGMYTIKLHALKDDEHEEVYVHESDLVRGRSTTRARLGSAPRQFSDKIGASTTKLFSFATNTAKLIGQNATAAAATARKASASASSPTSVSASNAVPTPAPTAASSRSKSMRVVESEAEADVEADVEVSSAGI